MMRSRDLCRMGLFLCLMVLGAMIRITLPTPFFSMHITLQIFVCIMTGLLLPSQAASVMGVYILAGLAGFPIFAGGGGLQYILRPTFGFVLGFLLCAALCAAVRKKAGPAGRRADRAASFAGLAVFYLAGNIYYYFSFRWLLGTPVPLAVCLFNCLAVSIVPDLLLAWTAAECAARLRRLMH